MKPHLCEKGMIMFEKYISKAIHLFESQESKILIPANFSDIK